MKSALIIGFGVSGKSVARFLAAKGCKLFVYDDKAEATAGWTSVERVGKEGFEACLEGLECVITSPGIFPTHPLVVLARKKNVPVFCDVELALRELVGGVLPKMVAVTGTNGKTTTTLLTAHILEKAGLRVKTLGNIGTPFLDELEALGREECVVVAELSSFQLETMSTRAFQAGVVLNITPNHLDYHETMDAYKRAKMRLKECVVPDGAFYCNEKVGGPGVPCFGFEETSAVRTDMEHIFRHGKKEAKLHNTLTQIPQHDLENFLAAYALCRELGVDPEVCVEAYCSFTKPNHRIQFVCESDGVAYYDDSKGTNIEATKCAVDALCTKGKIVLIAGGVHKGEPYRAWAAHFPSKVKHVITLGEAAPLIEQDLHNHLPVSRASSLQDAVLESKKRAECGDIVLLSPGCSSYDMFKNYKERGEKFQELVRGFV